MTKEGMTKDIWIFLFAIMGVLLVSFNKNLESYLNIPIIFPIITGILLIIASIIISLSKAWR